MKPPICVICNIKFDPLTSGGLIYFKRRTSDEEWHQRMKMINGKGHAPESAWFCESHYPIAQNLSHLTIDVALKEIKSKIN